MDALGVSRQNQILELDGVLGQRIHKVEVEVAKELGVVLEDHEHNVHGGGVEAAHGCRRLLSWNEIGLDERETVNDEVFHLVKA